MNRIPPVVLAVAAMSSVQVGAAVSVPVFATLGVFGTTWLRLAIAAAVLLVVVRPRGLAPAQLGAAAALGVVMATNSILFASATDRVPLGVVVAVEFCGPLAVAALGGRGPSRIVWPLVALAGVVVLSRPWTIGLTGSGQTWTGLGLAAGAGAGWAGYILLTARVGERSPGFDGLAVALTVAALALAPLGAGPVSSAVADGQWTAIARCALAAMLVPLGAFALEMTALRRMPSSVFGVWMALEPAFGALAGLALLSQPIALLQLPGFLLVVWAGVATQRAATSSPRTDLAEPGAVPGAPFATTST